MRLRSLAASGTMCATSLLAACSGESPTSFDVANATARPLAVAQPACEAITFEQFGHGDVLTSVALSGMTIQFAVDTYPRNPKVLGDEPPAPNVLRIANTAQQTVWEDADLQNPPVGLCQACADSAIGNIMVIEDGRGFDFWGDYRWGGTITLTGFAPGAYIQSYHAVDDDDGEPAMTLWVDGQQVASSTGLGNASVELVEAAAHTITTSAVFKLGTPVADAVTGSGGLDNIVVCTPPPPPPSNPGTGTIGYWKNHPDAWPVSDIVIGGTSYTRAAAITLMKTPGKGDKSYDMFAQLVAAKLNVAIGNDDDCIGDTIDAADGWMAAHPVGSKVKASSSAWKQASGWHQQLDDYNNGRLCAPHRG